MRLNVGMLGTEEFFGTVDSELLDDIDVFTSTIPTAAGVALGVFVGEERSLGFHHCGRGKIFRCDELDIVALAVLLCGDCSVDRRICLGDAAAGGFANTGLVTTTGKGGCQKCFCHGDGGCGICVFAAEAQHVSVIVAASDDCFIHRADVGSADVAVTVRRDAHADAGRAGEDAKIIGPIRDRAGYEICVIRVIHRVLSLGAEVLDLVADGFEMGDDGVLEIDGAVIGSDGNTKGRVTHGDCRIESRESNFANRKIHISDTNGAEGTSALRVRARAAGRQSFTEKFIHRRPGMDLKL